MAVPFLVWLIVGLVTILVLAIFVIAFVRHALVLSRSLARFSREVSPSVAEITAEANRASRRAAGFSGERPFGRS